MLDDIFKWLSNVSGQGFFQVPAVLVGEAAAASVKRWLDRVFQRDDFSIHVRLVSRIAQVKLQPAEVQGLRGLLEEPETWRSIESGRGTNKVEDLVEAVCEVLSDARHDEHRRQAACEIVGALLAEACNGLNEPTHWAVAFERLNLLGKAADSIQSTLDQVLLGQVAAIRERVSANSEDLKSLANAMDELQPKSVGRGHIEIYLRCLIASVDRDMLSIAAPGPQERPSTVECERRLGLENGGVRLADDLTDTASRLLVVGGPGSGKSWFACRTAARAASRALDELLNGADEAELEIPLYAPCEGFFEHARDKGPRRGVAFAALASADFTGKHVQAELANFLTSGRRLAVLDGLDEVPRGDLRVFQSLVSAGFRIVLTSRPVCQDEAEGALGIDRNDDHHCTGTLLPLTFPDDVEAVVRSRLPAEHQAPLLARLRRSPRLQAAARRPLLLAFSVSPLVMRPLSSASAICSTLPSPDFSWANGGSTSLRSMRGGASGR